MLITLARKPPAGTVAGTALLYGTGSINIDACRIVSASMPVSTTAPGWDSINKRNAQEGYRDSAYTQGHATYVPSDLGRWPANLIVGGKVTDRFPITTTNKGTLKTNADLGRHVALAPVRVSGTVLSEGDSGSAARFFKQVGASGC